jgi:hypothetical protein
MALGQAAGTAAAWAVTRGVDVTEVDGPELRAGLAAAGADVSASLATS